MSLATNAYYAFRTISAVSKLGFRAVRGDRAAWDLLAGMIRAASPFELQSIAPWDGAAVEIRFRQPVLKTSISDYESMALAALVRRLKPKTIFEIGTGDGYSAWIMAENSPPNAKLYTLDLPVGGIKNGALGDKESAEETHAAGIGRLVNGNPKVELLSGDSTAFNFEPFENSMDLIFIDGAHDQNTVRYDSESALRMARKGGVIVWHDADSLHNGVLSAIKELNGRHPLKQIAGTRFAVLEK